MIAVGTAEPSLRSATFEVLLTPILPVAYGTAVRLTRDRTEAEDLVQDAALLAFRGFGSFEPGTNFKAWFFRILTNAFYSRHRKEKHERANISTEDLQPCYLYNRIAETGLQSQEPDPASALMDRLDSEQVGEALDRLPTEYRVVASLYFIEDFSYQQIADVLGCPVGTVRSRLHRGRRMLQKTLWQVAEERGLVCSQARVGAILLRHAPEPSPKIPA
jgi:RNA polymerase sigma-70 factor (ECF subfamily)